MNSSCRPRIQFWWRQACQVGNSKTRVQDQLCQSSNCLGIPCAKLPATQQCFQKPSLSSGLPNAVLFPGPRGTCVSLYSRSVLYRFSFLLSCATRSSSCPIARWLSCARDEGLLVALSIVRLHVWDGSGRKYTFVSCGLGERMPRVPLRVLGRQRGVGAKLLGVGTYLHSLPLDNEKGRRRRRTGVQILLGYS